LRKHWVRATCGRRFGLALLGRDRDAADLVKGLLAEDPGKLTPEAMEDSVLPLYRAGDFASMVRAFESLPAAAAARPDLRDALWHSAAVGLDTSRDARLLRLLPRSIRSESRLRDVLEIADPFAAAISPEAALEVLTAERALLTDSGAQRELDAAMTRIKRLRR